MLFGNEPDLPLPGCKFSNNITSGVSCSATVLIQLAIGPRSKL